MPQSTLPFAGRSVLDLSVGIAGAYCTKILCDAGFDVVKVEDPSGDPLRRRSVTTSLRAGQDGALYQFLHTSKKSVVLNPESPADGDLLQDLISESDAIVWTPGSLIADAAGQSPRALLDASPATVVTAITPFGLGAPWADHPATEFTLQAWSGGPSQRGTQDTPPLAMGGESGLWIAGMFGAVGLLTALRRRDARGHGEIVDVSILESLIWTHTTYPVTYYSMAGRWNREKRVRNLPAIHPTSDGLVGFMVITAQQWFDFCVMVEQPSWLDDPSLLHAPARWARSAELTGAIDSWTSTRSTEEVVEYASVLRIPVAPVGTPINITSFDHFVERKVFVTNPAGFLQPDLPYRLGAGVPRPSMARAPKVGEHTDVIRERASRQCLAHTTDASAYVDRPFDDLRVVDITTFWAGPTVGNFMAMMGADVIHVESAMRLDGSRQNNTVQSLDEDDWWEWTPSFHGANAGKRDFAVNLQTPEGRQLLTDLVAVSDILLENYSPRVMDNFGLFYEDLARLNPRLIMVRMPAFGLSGPWRDFTGYAQTMEMSSGLAWMTGFPNSPPELPNGPCDPIAGSHATIAILAALEHRRRTGQGMLVEAPMIGGALNLAAEVVLEHSAYGTVVQRYGNRNPFAAPQGLYLTADQKADGTRDQWVALSVSNDAQWLSLCEAVGLESLAGDEKLRSLEGRVSAHDLLDQLIASWCGGRTCDQVVQELRAAAVPVARLIQPFEQTGLAPVQARGFFEELDHAITGRHPLATYPARFSSGPTPLYQRPAPLLGQHNSEILVGLLGRSDDEVGALEAAGIIGNRPPS